ncbi:MAG: hypothetical protein ABI772_10875 [Bacteroidota bacterium]
MEKKESKRNIKHENKSLLQSDGSVMIINDSVLETHYLLSFINKCGIEGKILTQKSAWVALEYLQQEYKAGKSLPKLIILDMQMPELNGCDFLEAFQEVPELIKNYCSIVVINAGEEKCYHDKIMQFPQVKYYLTDTLSLEVIERMIPILINIGR